MTKRKEKKFVLVRYSSEWFTGSIFIEQFVHGNRACNDEKSMLEYLTSARGEFSGGDFIRERDEVTGAFIYTKVAKWLRARE